MESHVAAEFGISRAPARQALAALAREGLATRVTGRGYLATPPDGAAPGSPEPDAVQLSSAAGWERIYSEIELNVVSRTAFGAWRVIEAEIAAHFGVSRTVVRDVVARLNQRGIVRKDERSHWYAPALTQRHVAELYEMRWTLEPLALEKAAALIPPDIVRRDLRSIEAAMDRAATLSGGDLDALEADLHVELLGYCEHLALIEALNGYRSLLAAHSFLYRQAPSLYPSEPFLPEHHAVLEALAAGRAKQASDALRSHLQAALTRALARLEAITADFKPDPIPYLRPVHGPRPNDRRP